MYIQILDTTKKVLELLPNKSKKLFKNQVFLNILIVLLEPVLLMTIGVLAFLIVNDLNFSANNELLKNLFNKIISIFGSDNLFFVAVKFIIIYFCINILVLLIRIYNLKLFLNLKLELSKNLFENLIHKNWLFHVANSKSLLIKQVKNDTSRTIDGILAPFIELIVNFLKLIVIFITFSIIDFKLTIIFFLFIGSVYLSVIFLADKKLKEIGNKVSLIDGVTIKSLFNSFNAIKNIILKNQQSYFIKYFNEFNFKLQSFQTTQKIYALVPNYLIKTISVSSFIFLIFLAKTYFPQLVNKDYLILLVIFIYGSNRMLQSFGICFNNYSKMIQFTQSFENIKNNFIRREGENITHKEDDKSENINSFVSLELQDINFKYSDSYAKIENINLKIKKNEIFGIAGVSGSGKSTLIDIIVKLIEPDNGSILVNEINIKNDNKKSWQKIISYVSQSSFFIEGTLINNIAFGKEEKDIDKGKIEFCLKNAELEDLINRLPNGVNSILQDGGLNLSGGERQRIAIARALYENFDFIILDEATNAIDHETEKKIIKNIQKLGKTTLIVSHSKENLLICDNIIILRDGKIVSNKIDEYFSD